MKGYSFDKKAGAPLHELLGIPAIPGDIMQLWQMDAFIEAQKADAFRLEIVKPSVTTDF